MHAAVVTNTDIGREYLGQTGWWQWLVQMSENNKIPTVHIQDILDTDTFEALKMDIEWWEFPIMERFANHSEKFSFKKWYIEFHRVNQESYYDKTQTAIDFIQQQWYKIEVYDYPGNRIDRDAIKDQKKAPYIVVYFEKI